MEKHVLHDRIHRIVKKVPIPSEKDCVKALNDIRWFLECEMISLDDTAEQKLKVLISIFGKNPKNQETIAALKLQKEIVADFYAHHKGGR